MASLVQASTSPSSPRHLWCMLSASSVFYWPNYLLAMKNWGRTPYVPSSLHIIFRSLVLEKSYSSGFENSQKIRMNKLHYQQIISIDRPPQFWRQNHVHLCSISSDLSSTDPQPPPQQSFWRTIRLHYNKCNLIPHNAHQTSSKKKPSCNNPLFEYSSDFP